MTFSTAEIWTVIVIMGIGTFLIRFSFLGMIGDRPMPPIVLPIRRLLCFLQWSRLWLFGRMQPMVHLILFVSRLRLLPWGWEFGAGTCFGQSGPELSHFMRVCS